jgi:hypothetical protein
VNHFDEGNTLPAEVKEVVVDIEVKRRGARRERAIRH